jgi:heme/copper-type cytochrome/quinol oxidase subunit 2
MRQTAHVVSQQTFQAWLAQQQKGASGAPSGGGAAPPAGGSAPGPSASASPTIPAN